VLVGIMIAALVIVLALALAPSMLQFTNGAMNETSVTGGNGLNCTSTLISDYDKGACVLIDLFTPIFFIILLGVAGIIITLKLILDYV
jgi:hypothetical protein